MKIMGYFVASLVAGAALLTGFSVESKEPSSSEQLTLWGTSVSPYVRKVMNVLETKKLAYTQEEILPKVLLEALGEEVPEAFQNASPLGKIPAFSVGQSQAIADSAVIVAFIEKQYPGFSVYPSESRLYADALWLEKYADTVMSDAIHPIFVERVVKPAVLGAGSDESLVAHLVDAKVPAVLSYLNRWLENKGSQALVGDKPSIADFAVVNHLIDLDVAKVTWRGQYPALEAYHSRMMEVEAIQTSIPSILKG